MAVSVLRTSDGWWVEDPSTAGAVPVATSARTTAELLADRDAVDKAAEALTDDAARRTATADLAARSPVTTPCRVVAPMVNYRTHAIDSGFNPETVPATFFRKASGSVCGPTDTVVRPAHVTLLDYEVELGLVLARHLPVGTEISDSDLHQWVAGLVVTNDISARDVQLPKGQFYEGKSYPTFTPIGPRLVLLDRQDWAHLDRLRLTLSVNGETRQDQPLTDMIVRPAPALTALARFQTLDAGDVMLTGTPGGTALKAPPRPIELLGTLLPPHVKWRLFLQGQAKNPRYLQDGDVIEARIATPDGALDLGTQHTPVRHA
jgi:2-keto-4-pentenoate hydratase/2-oxohepta-3-ene-1,7-dioic acid hydratase in catechol pathway